MAFEKYVLPANNDPKMSIHLFVAILSEYLQGTKTSAESRAAIEEHLGVTLSTDEVQDIVSVLTYVDAGTGDFNKRNRLDELYRVLILAEHDTWYNTQELVKARLNWA